MITKPSKTVNYVLSYFKPDGSWKDESVFDRKDLAIDRLCELRRATFGYPIKIIKQTTYTKKEFLNI